MRKRKGRKGRSSCDDDGEKVVKRTGDGEIRRHLNREYCGDSISKCSSMILRTMPEISRVKNGVFEE